MKKEMMDIGGEYSKHKFGTDDLTGIEGMIDMAKERKKDGWSLSDQLRNNDSSKGISSIVPSIRNKIIDVSEHFSIKYVIVLNSLIDRGVFRLSNYTMKVSDNTSVVNLMEYIRSTFLMHDTERELGGPQHLDFFGNLDGASNEFFDFMKTTTNHYNIKRDDRVRIGYEIGYNVGMFLSNAKLLGMNTQRTMDLVCMAGLTFDYKFDNPAWADYPDIPYAYSDAADEFIKSVGSRIVKMVDDGLI